MNKPWIIGLTGNAHSGKDTSADYMATMFDKYHYNIIKISLADQLKNICQDLVKLFYGIELPIEYFHDESMKEKIFTEFPQFNGQPFKIRTLLQQIGTNICRNKLSTDIWCQYLYNHFIKNNDSDIIIISDIRMPDEIEYFNGLVNSGYIQQFTTIRINRQSNKIDDINQQHETEKNINKLQVSEDIDNNQTICELYRKLDHFMENHLKCGYGCGGTSTSIIK